MIDVPRHPSFNFPGAWLRSNSAEIHLVQEDFATHAPGDLSFQVAARLPKMPPGQTDGMHESTRADRRPCGRSTKTDAGYPTRRESS